jgi:hypothetical protein
VPGHAATVIRYDVIPAPAGRAGGVGAAHSPRVFATSSSTAARAGWGSLAALVERLELVEVTPQCPNDGFLLARAPDGSLWCPFDGWRGGPPTRPAGPDRRDWGGLRAATTGEEGWP